MKQKFLTVFATLILVVAALPASVSAQGGGNTRQVPAAGTTSIRTSTPNTGVGPQQPEIRSGSDSEEGAGSFDRPRPGFKNGKFPKKPLDAPTVPSSAVAGSNPELANSFDGLNHFDQRTANGGNQFSLEPPDQGLCAGNGFVVEVVNSVIQVWDTANGSWGLEYVLWLSRCHQPGNISRSQFHWAKCDRSAVYLRLRQ